MNRDKTGSGRIAQGGGRVAAAGAALFGQRARDRRQSLGMAAVAATLLFSVSFAANAEQLTTVGVVDARAIYTEFYSNALNARRLEQIRERFGQDIDRQTQTLNILRQRRAQAEEAENNEMIARIDATIANESRRLEQMIDARQQALARQAPPEPDNDFLVQLQQAIIYVAESQGFTVVLDADSNELLWWSYAVDITEMVENRLRETTVSNIN